jgi:hypothetical protein
MSYPI